MSGGGTGPVARRQRLVDGGDILHLIASDGRNKDKLFNQIMELDPGYAAWVVGLPETSDEHLRSQQNLPWEIS